MGTGTRLIRNKPSVSYALGSASGLPDARSRGPLARTARPALPSPASALGSGGSTMKADERVTWEDCPNCQRAAAVLGERAARRARLSARLLPQRGAGPGLRRQARSAAGRLVDALRERLARCSPRGRPLGEPGPGVSRSVPLKDGPQRLPGPPP